ncbi:MAG: hypothetical protein VXW22_14495, partial [Pseudomonadota bacterium]|nr:hypothetical protein [Pseudomonadota bacterium]
MREDLRIFEIVIDDQARAGSTFGLRKTAALISALCCAAAAQAPQAEAAKAVYLMPNPSFEERDREGARGV